jgi:predicted ATPase
LASTLYFLGDFETSQQYAMRGLEIWRSGGVQSQVEGVSAPAVNCLCFKALSEWHFGEIPVCKATMAEAIALAKELNDMGALAVALFFAGHLAHLDGNRAEVERLAVDLIELSTSQNFALWLPTGAVFRGWARAASLETHEGISSIEDGIGKYRATGSMVFARYFLALKAEALYLVNRTQEAFEAISEAEALAQRSEDRFWCIELHRLRGVFLAALGAEEAQIEASFCEAISIAKEQKSVSLEKRAEETYAEYRRQKASGSGGRGFRLP